MELRRGVAYDSELVAEVRRRLGDGLVELSLVTRLTRQRRMTSSMAGSGPCQREISSVANRP